MITLNVSLSPFILDITSDEGNEWMIKNVGELIHDDFDHSYGAGWRVLYKEEHWFVEFDDEKHATLFMLWWA